MACFVSRKVKLIIYLSSGRHFSMQITTTIGAPKHLFHQAKPVTHSFWCRGFEGGNLEAFANFCALEKMVQRVINGRHASCIAFGHKFSGKEDTIFGSADRKKIDEDNLPQPEVYGLSQQALISLLEKAGPDAEIGMSMLELYFEKLYDLLNESTVLPDVMCENKGRCEIEGKGKTLVAFSLTGGFFNVCGRSSRKGLGDTNGSYTVRYAKRHIFRGRGKRADSS